MPDRRIAKAQKKLDRHLAQNPKSGPQPLTPRERWLKKYANNGNPRKGGW